MTTSLTKTTKTALTHNEAPAKSLKIKHVMLVDTGDGAFTDDSVKIKPHKDDASKMVFKCVDAARLLKALTNAGLCAIDVIKGSKHYIATVDAAAVQTALAASTTPAPMLSSSATKLLS